MAFFDQLGQFGRYVEDNVKEVRHCVDEPVLYRKTDQEGCLKALQDQVSVLKADLEHVVELADPFEEALEVFERVADGTEETLDAMVQCYTQFGYAPPIREKENEDNNTAWKQQSTPEKAELSLEAAPTLPPSAPVSPHREETPSPLRTPTLADYGLSSSTLALLQGGRSRHRVEPVFALSDALQGVSDEERGDDSEGQLYSTRHADHGGDDADHDGDDADHGGDDADHGGGGDDGDGGSRGDCDADVHVDDDGDDAHEMTSVADISLSSDAIRTLTTNKTELGSPASTFSFSSDTKKTLGQQHDSSFPSMTVADNETTSYPNYDLDSSLTTSPSTPTALRASAALPSALISPCLPSPAPLSTTTRQRLQTPSLQAAPQAPEHEHVISASASAATSVEFSVSSTRTPILNSLTVGVPCDTPVTSTSLDVPVSIETLAPVVGATVASRPVTPTVSGPIASVSSEELQKTPSYLRSQLDVAALNAWIGRINQCFLRKQASGQGTLSQAELQEEVGLGARTKLVILLLIKLTRLQSVHVSGATVYKAV